MKNFLKAQIFYVIVFGIILMFVLGAVNLSSYLAENGKEWLERHDHHHDHYNNHLTNQYEETFRN